MKTVHVLRASAPLLIVISIASASTLSGSEPTARQVEFFENKIRPVLAENCYSCHNSVGKKKGKIALDYRAALIESKIIVPGSPAKSRLIRAIRHLEGAEPMPSKAPKLAKLLIKNFEDWIRMGAPDPRTTKPTKEDIDREVDWDSVRDQRAEWWSFQPIRAAAPPSIENDEWKGSSIDRFVYARMKAAGLTPKDRAGAAVLIRRLYLTLVGTPPKPEIVDAFVANPSVKAYEEIVDELLASDAFGERWGRYWLDWFRFAESHGSEGDPSIPYASIYRDYAIRALNADVPYDQLLREAIAGDLLAEPRVNEELGLNESAIGPAHFRMVPHGFGVTDAYDEQITFTDNQVDVVSKAILGVTLSCARCHNHKFDPLSQKDFYKFYGMMISSRPGMVNVDSPALKKKNRAELQELKPVIRAGLADLWARELPKVIEALESGDGLDALKKEAQSKDSHPLHAWFQLEGGNPESIARDWRDLITRHESRAREKQSKIAQATYYADLRDQSEYDRWFKTGLGLGDKVAPAGSFAVAVEGVSALVSIYPRGIYSHLISDKDDANLGSVFHLATGDYTAVHAFGRNAMARFSTRSYPLSHGGLHPTPNVPGNPSWMRLRKYTYWNGEKIFYQLSTGSDKTVGARKGRGWFGVTEVWAGRGGLPDLGHPAATLPGNHDSVRDRATLLAFYRRALEDAVTGWKKGELSDAGAILLDALRRHGKLTDRLGDLPDSLRKAVETYRKLEAEIRIPERAPGVLEGQPWDQPLLVRGSYKNESDPVERGFLEVFGGRKYSKSNSGRLELVEDLLSENNSLTARVIVNRLWHHTFGRGLVSSTDNLGRLGDPPSHPELLDHLASELRRDGWSMKRMIRRLVTSRAFLSESRPSENAADVDPSNKLLSYYTPRRLDAEAVLDTIESVAGNLGRRAVYRRVQRNRLDPFLTAFNLPIPTSTVGVRDQTNVPAQSLLLLNGDIVRRAAESWAQRLTRDTELKTNSDRVERLFREAYSRAPTKAELDACIEFLAGKKDDDKLQHLEDQVAAESAAVAQFEKLRSELLRPTREKLQAGVDARNAKAKAEAAEAPADLRPIAHWDFEKDLRDRIGSLHGKMVGRGRLRGGAVELAGGMVATEPMKKTLREKSLEVLVQLTRPDRKGGGAMTIQDLRGRGFDSIVWAEVEPRHWLAGSDNHSRTEPFDGKADYDAEKRPVRVIMTWAADGTVRGYLDGKPYGRGFKTEGPRRFEAGDSQVVFGLRHGTEPGGGRSLSAKIFEARLYDRALTPAEALAASTGEVLEQLTEAQIIAALDSSTKTKLEQLDEALSSTRGKRDRLVRERDATRDARARTPTGFARLTHAILNSKELIYVH